MFVEPDIDDVVPTGRVVALETPVHARVLLARELLGDHREMLHEVTRRRLMTLHAFFGSRGRVLVTAHRPRLERVEGRGDLPPLVRPPSQLVMHLPVEM